MALLIPFGVLSHTLVPALGLVPLTMSAVFGLVKLHGYIDDDYRIHAVTIYAVTIDGLISLLLMGIAIPGFFVVVAESARFRFRVDPMPMLGSFSMFPLLLNM